MSDKAKNFQKILDMSMEFSQARDVDLLLEKILAMALEFVNAELGSIYLMEGETLHYHHSRHGTVQTPLQENTERSVPTLPANSLPAYIAKTGEVVNIPNLVTLEEDLPYTPDRSHESYANVDIASVLALALNNSHGKVLGVIQVLNLRNQLGELSALPEDDIPLIQLFATNAAAAIERAQATRSRIQGIIQIMTALRDTEETVAHVNRVGAYSTEIYAAWAGKKGLPEKEILSQKNTLRMAAMLHDIGKLAIPSVIRKKPGKLNEEEYNTMKEHTIKGAQLLLKHANSEIENVAAQIALTHHERWDGHGYPGYVDPNSGNVLPDHEDDEGKALSKKGEEIPVFGRVVAIADVYDALSHHRVFRQAWKEEDILKKLKAESGTHFDPDMIEAFFASLDKIHAISTRFSDE
ncbi:MAG: HD domain-containing protein [bacterium]|nr:HD domain-containing protein [bacterium]